MDTPFNTCHEVDAPVSAADRELYSSHAPAWMGGTEGVPRPVSAATDSCVQLILVAVFVLIGFSMRHVRRLFRSLPGDLLSVRRRANVFDDHTANETRVVMLLLANTCVMEGLLLFVWLGQGGVVPDALPAMAALTGLAAGFYLFQFAACATVGYVFTDSVGASLWRRGLNASQVVLGMALAVPALVSLFYPDFASSMLLFAAVVYILSRLFYVSKGFRIFYHNLPSLLYFILYLCTLEIIPVMAIIAMASEICVKVQ